MALNVLKILAVKIENYGGKVREHKTLTKKDLILCIFWALFWILTANKTHFIFIYGFWFIITTTTAGWVFLFAMKIGIVCYLAWMQGYSRNIAEMFSLMLPKLINNNSKARNRPWHFWTLERYEFIRVLHLLNIQSQFKWLEHRTTTLSTWNSACQNKRVHCILQCADTEGRGACSITFSTGMV